MKPVEVIWFPKLCPHCKGIMRWAYVRWVCFRCEENE